ncbi:MAG: alpha-hydroxy-acid oxidizing protein [Pseudomonadota bacterium]
MNFKPAFNIEDLRRMAERRLPCVAYDYLEGGAEEDATLGENRAVFGRIRLKPRTLVDVSRRSQQTTLFGDTFNMPFGIAPTGAAGLYCFEADIALALLGCRSTCILIRRGRLVGIERFSDYVIG